MFKTQACIRSTTTTTTVLNATSLRSATRKPQLQQIRNITVGSLNAHKGDRERVVILGSGWGGYTLARSLDQSKYQTVIVSPRSYFVFTPLLASTSVGTLEFRTAVEPIRRRGNKTHYVPGWADDVDFENKMITVEESIRDPRQSLALTSAPSNPSHDPSQDGATTQMPCSYFSSAESDTAAGPRKKGPTISFDYDKLVIAVGCYTQTFNIPGVKEHANFLKDVGDARKIRSKLLECFEMAALPTTPEPVRRQLLRFIIVGGGPTGIEFAAELHDLVRQDLARLFPCLQQYITINLYDVAPNILSMFDQKLSNYAQDNFKRGGIDIRTSRHVRSISPGLPDDHLRSDAPSTPVGLTLDIEGEGPVGAGICVWSTGLMMNPFISQMLREKRIPATNAIYGDETASAWQIEKHAKTGSISTDSQLRVLVSPSDNSNAKPAAYLKDVFAIGDCANIKDTAYPPTAQVASQKAEWLALRLNKADLTRSSFVFKNLGIMAYIGNWRAIFQGRTGGSLTGHAAWVLWRSAYLFKTLSWRNRILVAVYWRVNSLFGRDVSRF